MNVLDSLADFAAGKTFTASRDDVALFVAAQERSEQQLLTARRVVTDLVRTADEDSALSASVSDAAWQQAAMIELEERRGCMSSRVQAREYIHRRSHVEVVAVCFTLEVSEADLASWAGGHVSSEPGTIRADIARTDKDWVAGHGDWLVLKTPWVLGCGSSVPQQL